MVAERRPVARGSTLQKEAKYIIKLYQKRRRRGRYVEKEAKLAA